MGFNLQNLNEANNDNNNNENNNNNNNNVGNIMNNKENNNNLENDNHTLDELEKKLKTFVHQIKIEGASPANYVSHLKESIDFNNNPVEVINVKKLNEFLITKKIELNEDEINLLQKIYSLGEANNEQKNTNEYINYETFVQKLLKIIQNDSGVDGDFMENIPVMDIGGME